MKKLHSLIPAFFLALILIAVAGESSAYGPVTRLRSRIYIRRTTAVILVANKAVKEHKVYTGDLARAVAHQRYAKLLFVKGSYLRAIHHSHRARVLAALAIRANKKQVPAESNNSPQDDELFKGGPSDRELDNEVQKGLPDAPAKDEDIPESLNDIDIQ